MRTLRLLLVDDCLEFRRLLARLLLRPGYQVVGSVASGEEALAALAGSAPDVVILDLAMAGLGGLETAKRIRREHAGIKIVILSLHSTPEYRAAAAAVGVHAYVCKANLVPELPVALAELCA